MFASCIMRPRAPESTILSCSSSSAWSIHRSTTLTDTSRSSAFHLTLFFSFAAALTLFEPAAPPFFGPRSSESKSMIKLELPAAFARPVAAAAPVLPEAARAAAVLGTEGSALIFLLAAAVAAAAAAEPVAGVGRALTTLGAPLPKKSNPPPDAGFVTGFFAATAGMIAFFAPGLVSEDAVLLSAAAVAALVVDEPAVVAADVEPVEVPTFAF